MNANEIQGRRKFNRITFLIFLGIVAVLFAIMFFFNGKLFMLTTGMKAEVIGTVDSNEILKADAYILLCDAKEQYESVFTDAVWKKKFDGKSFEEYVRDQARVKLLRLASLELFAKDKGIAISREDKNNIAKAANEFFGMLSEADKNEFGITAEQVEKLYTRMVIAKEVFAEMTDNADFEVSADEARVISIQVIVLDDKSKADEAMVRVANKESFLTVAKTYSITDECSLVVKRGEFEKAFEDEAFNLKSGEVSKATQIDDKYYIIKCVSDNEKTMSEANRNTIIEKKKLELFNKTIDEYESKVFVEFKDKEFNAIRINDLPDFNESFESIFNKYF